MGIRGNYIREALINVYPGSNAGTGYERVIIMALCELIDLLEEMEPSDAHEEEE